MLNVAWGQTATVTDELNRELTGVTGTSYTNWSDKQFRSSAVYAGNSAGGNSSIQLRSNNPSGIVTTTSGGKVKKITVEWNANTANGRTLDIYGKNTAYSAASDLYNSSTQGTKLGSITKNSTTSLSVTGDYAYIGLRSKDGAMYLTSITIEWETTNYIITAQSNNTEYGTVSLSGNKITATPKTGYRISTSNPYTVTSGTATVSQNGNVFTVNATANCTVQINFEAIPTYTATFTANGTVVFTAQYQEGDAITFPTNPEDEEDYKFMGWTTAEITGTSATAPTMVTSSTMGTTAQNFYAVYALLSGGEEPITKICDFEEATNSDWTIDGPVRNNEGPKNGNYSGKINTNNTYVTFKDKVNVTSFSFAFTRTTGNSNYNVYIETSEDGDTWTAVETYAMSSFNNDGTFSTKTRTFDGTTALYVRFHCSNTTAVRYVDDVTITYGAPASYSDYCTSVITKPSPELSYAQESYLAILSNPNEFTTPVLVNPHQVQGITYSSESPSIAEVNATTGAVTLKALGTTVITASFAGNDDYKAGTASYTLKVVDIPVTTFSPASGTTVKVGDKILVQYTGTVNSVSYAINDGDFTTVETTNYYPVTITDEMVVDDQVEIQAYHTYIVDNTTLTSETITAIYNVVNPVVTFVTPASVFAESIDVTLSASPSNATIYYTLDGTNPTASSTQYNGAITLTATTTIKAIAVVEGFTSAVASATYTKNEPATTSHSDYYTLVKNGDTLADGDEIIIVEPSQSRAISKVTPSGFSDSYQGYTTITFADSNIKELAIANDDTRIITLKLEENDGKAHWVLYADNNQAFYGSTDNSTSGSSQNNSLTLNSSNSGVTKYTKSIDIDNDNYAHIYYSDIREIEENTNSNGLFGTYRGTQKKVCIYRKVDIEAVNLYENPEDFDKTENTITAQDDVTVNLYRSLTADMWNAICLPFSLTTEQRNTLFGEGHKLQKFDNIGSDNGGTQLNFVEVTGATVAGEPYIVMPTQSVQKNAVVVLSNVNITSTEPTVVNVDDYTFQGIYNPTQLNNITSDPKQVLFIGANNKFYWPNTSTPMKAFRAYFIVPADAAGAGSMALGTDDNGIITSIPMAELDGLFIQGVNDRVYTISGQYIGTKTEGLAKGIYIVNGRKFIVK